MHFHGLVYRARSGEQLDGIADLLGPTAELEQVAQVYAGPNRDEDAEGHTGALVVLLDESRGLPKLWQHPAYRELLHRLQTEVTSLVGVDMAGPTSPDRASNRFLRAWMISDSRFDVNELADRVADLRDSVGVLARGGTNGSREAGRFNLAAAVIADSVEKMDAFAAGLDPATMFDSTDATIGLRLDPADRVA